MISPATQVIADQRRDEVWVALVSAAMASTFVFAGVPADDVFRIATGADISSQGHSLELEPNQKNFLWGGIVHPDVAPPVVPEENRGAISLEIPELTGYEGLIITGLTVVPDPWRPPINQGELHPEFPYSLLLPSITSDGISHTHWRWYDNDSADNTLTTPISDEDTQLFVNGNTDLDASMHLRIKMENRTGGAVTDDYRLTYRKNGSGGFVDVSGASSDVRAIAGLPTDGDQVVAERLTPGLLTFVSGEYDDVDGVGTRNTPNNRAPEFVWSVQFLSADNAAGDSYEFRVELDTLGSVDFRYDVTATAVVQFPVPEELQRRLIAHVPEPPSVAPFVFAHGSFLADENFDPRKVIDPGRMAVSLEQPLHIEPSSFIFGTEVLAPFVPIPQLQPAQIIQGAMTDSERVEGPMTAHGAGIHAPMDPNGVGIDGTIDESQGIDGDMT